MMITRQLDDNNAFIGLSTDSKPENANNGSSFFEMDTSAIYYYDATNEEWSEFGAASGSSTKVEPITITENGTYTAQSHKAYSPITVSVPQTTIQSATFTVNGSYTAPAGVAYSPVTIDVPQTTVESITITENNTYTAPSGKAYSPITVDVPQTTVESITITENNTYTAPTGTAYSPIVVNVPQTTVEAFSITVNGTYTAPSGSAYSPVTVNVEEEENMNLLDNWYFVRTTNDNQALPINQRNITTQQTSGTCIDRWKFYTNATSGNSVKLQSNYGLVLTKEAGNYQGYIYQDITVAVQSYNQLTFSVYYESPDASHGKPYMGVQYLSGNNTYLLDSKQCNSGLNTLTINTSTSGSRYRLRVIFGSFSPNYVGIYTAYITAMKLEFGSKSTLMYDASIGVGAVKDMPIFALEAVKCQQYQVDLARPNLLTSTNANQYIGMGYATSTTTAIINCQLPQTLIQPASELITSGTFYLTRGGSESYEVTNIALRQTCGNTVQVDVTVADGLTDGNVYTLVGGNSTVSFLITTDY